jgi:predicted ester cyclase
MAAAQQGNNRRVTMSTAANKAQSERWFEEVWNRRRAECIFEMLPDDAVGHLEHGDTVGPEAFAQIHRAFLTAFPDLRVTVEGTVAEGEDVAIRWTVSATHRGEFFGIPPTGKPVRVGG